MIFKYILLVICCSVVHEASCQNQYIDIDTSIIAHGEAVEGNKEGVWSYFHRRDTSLFFLATFSSNRLNGVAVIYHFDGSGPWVVGKFKDGRLDGDVYSFTPSGKLVGHSIFENDLFQYNELIILNPFGPEMSASKTYYPFAILQKVIGSPAWVR